MSATISRIAVAAHVGPARPAPPPNTRAAWAAMSALLRYLDLADRLAREPEGTPMHKAFSEQAEGAKRAAAKACDNFVGTV